MPNRIGIKYTLIVLKSKYYVVFITLSYKQFQNFIFYTFLIPTESLKKNYLEGQGG